jgi:hypothetical protein
MRAVPICDTRSVVFATSTIQGDYSTTRIVSYWYRPEPQDYVHTLINIRHHKNVSSLTPDIFTNTTKNFEIIQIMQENMLHAKSSVILTLKITRLL